MLKQFIFVLTTVPHIKPCPHKTQMNQKKTKENMSQTNIF